MDHRPSSSSLPDPQRRPSVVQLVGAGGRCSGGPFCNYIFTLLPPLPAADVVWPLNLSEIWSVDINLSSGIYSKQAG